MPAESGEAVMVGVGAPPTALEKAARVLNAPVLEMPNQFEAHRAYALDVLEKRGFLERHGEDIVVDLERFTDRHMHFDSWRQSLGPITRKTYGQDSLMGLMDRMFRGLPVYSKQDWERKSAGDGIEPRPLFYVPNSKAQALDRQAIHRASFYLGLWQLPGNLSETYPTRKKDDAPLTTWDAVAAALIYHPQFGNGFRSDKGVLMVNYPTADGRTQRKPISGDFFKKMGWVGSPGLREHAIHISPSDFFTHRTQELVQRRDDNGQPLLDPARDFKTLGGYKTSETFVGLQPVTESGQASVKGTNKRYGIGREFGGRDFRVYKLSDRHAGIVRIHRGGKMSLERIIGLDVIDHTKVQPVMQKGKLSYETVGKGGFQMLTREDARESLGSIDQLFTNFHEYYTFAQRLMQETAMSHTSMPLGMQAEALTLYRQYEKDRRFWNLLRKHNEDGLKALLLVGRSGSAMDVLFDLGGREESRLVMNEVAGIYDTLSDYESLARPTLSSDKRKSADDLAGVALSHTTALLYAAHEAVNGRITGGQYGDVMEALRLFRRRLYEAYHISFGLHQERVDVRSLMDELSGPDTSDSRRAVLLERFTREWGGEGGAGVARVVAATRAYYEKNTGLYTDVPKTGDTAKEQENFRAYVLEREATGRPITGTVLDVGTGLVGRMSKFLEETLPHTKVVGFDLIRPEFTKKSFGLARTELLQANAIHLPFSDLSLDGATLFWSVFNDNNPDMQKQLVAELARVLKPGAEVYMGAPHLEGEGKSWLPNAERYHQTHRGDPLGRIEEQVGERTKHFDITPESAIIALFNAAGFDKVKTTEWVNAGGMPRKDYAFQRRKASSAYLL